MGMTQNTGCMSLPKTPRKSSPGEGSLSTPLRPPSPSAALDISSLGGAYQVVRHGVDVGTKSGLYVSVSERDPSTQARVVLATVIACKLPQEMTRKLKKCQKHAPPPPHQRVCQDCGCGQSMEQEPTCSVASIDTRHYLLLTGSQVLLSLTVSYRPLGLGSATYESSLLPVTSQFEAMASVYFSMIGLRFLLRVSI